MKVKGKLVARNLKELGRLLQRTESRVHLPLGEILLRRGSISQEQLESALQFQNNKQHLLLGKGLEEMGSAPRSTIDQALMEKFAIPYLELSDYKVSTSIAALIPSATIREHKILPLVKANNTIWVATNHPLDPGLLNDIYQQTSYRIRDVIASEHFFNLHFVKFLQVREKLTLDRIRLLCSIGLNSQLVIPTVIQEVHRLIPSCCTAFYWLDCGHKVLNAYVDSPTCIKTIPNVNATQQNRKQISVVEDVPKDSHTNICVGKKDCSVQDECQQKNLGKCELPFPQHEQHAYYAHIDQQGKQKGLIGFYRRKNIPEFSQREIKLIEQINPILSLALESCGQWENQFMEVSYSGNLIIDINGKIQSTCSQGRKILHYAMGPDVKNAKSIFVPKEIIAFCQTFASEPFEESSLSSVGVLHRENHWGTFKFRIQPLQYFKKLGECFFDINIQHILPATLAFFSDWDKWGLPPKQTDVCLLWICGLPHNEIAKKLDIKPSTVIDHIRKIYQRFEVHGQAELLSKMRMMNSV